MLTRPLDDDVVIAFANDHWEVGLGSAPASMFCPSQGGAVAIAAAFAAAHSVDVWVAHHGEPFERIVRSRADRATADRTNEVPPTETTSAWLPSATSAGSSGPGETQPPRRA